MPNPNAITLHACPSCGAPEGQPCRTPRGRIRRDVHDTRPFSLTTETLTETPPTDAAAGMAELRQRIRALPGGPAE